jgi:uncharacterized ferritin-like protein (DUF455 family)
VIPETPRLTDPDENAALDALRAFAHTVLCVADPSQKIALLIVTDAAAMQDASSFAHARCIVPGRPSRPLLVSPRELKHRSMASPQGRATLIHAIAHIEFNAINLALDIVWRFPLTSLDFANDWLTVAREEAMHFSLLREHLQSLGYDYGDFPAHNGLWEMAEKTEGDLLARLALVPRTLEARGLDVSPAMRDKLAQAGDHRAAEILDIILRDEIGHVAIGNKWFRFYCAELGLDPLIAFEQLSTAFDAPLPRPPFNVDARLKAGFLIEEIDWLNAQANAPNDLAR